MSNHDVDNGCFHMFVSFDNTYELPDRIKVASVVKVWILPEMVLANNQSYTRIDLQLHSKHKKTLPLTRNVVVRVRSLAFVLLQIPDVVMVYMLLLLESKYIDG